MNKASETSKGCEIRRLRGERDKRGDRQMKCVR